MTDDDVKLTVTSIYVPDDGYLAKCAEICKKYNVLLICDEIQTGLCRTGKMSVLPEKIAVQALRLISYVGCAMNGIMSGRIWLS